MFRIAAFTAVVETLLYLAIGVSLAVRAGPGSSSGVPLILLGPVWIAVTLRIFVGLKLAVILSSGDRQHWLLNATVTGLVLVFLQIFPLTFSARSSMILLTIPFLAIFHVVAAVAYHRECQRPNPK